ncbi:ArsR/SmtB family transcription factor [Streptomyces sp. NPDC056049]|uniref:ArsR/SmtB family transcription factor n=1 Tax=unclassified Streptomyces TaxID=2593676 RepID=UPI0035D5C32C
MKSPDSKAAPLSPENLDFCVGLFKTLADPTRLHLLNVLATEQRPMTVGEIADRVPIGQSTVSHHLKALAGMRFVRSERAGTSTLYEVDVRGRERFDTAVRAILGRP